MEEQDKLKQLENDLDLALRRVRASVLYGGQSNLEVCYKNYLGASDRYWKERDCSHHE